MGILLDAGPHSGISNARYTWVGHSLLGHTPSGHSPRRRAGDTRPGRSRAGGGPVAHGCTGRTPPGGGLRWAACTPLVGKSHPVDSEGSQEKGGLRASHLGGERFDRVPDDWASVPVVTKRSLMGSLPPLLCRQSGFSKEIWPLPPNLSQNLHV